MYKVDVVYYRYTMYKSVGGYSRENQYTLVLCLIRSYLYCRCYFKMCLS